MRIISTQIPNQFEKLKALFTDEVEVLNMPMITIKPIEESDELLDTIKKAVGCNWLIFTSIRGVSSFFSLYDKTAYEREKLNHLKFACIGKSTNKELNKLGFHAAFINPGNTSKDFSEYLIKDGVLTSEDQVFLPLGNMANDYLPTKLAEFCNVTRVNVYETEGVENVDPEILEIVKKGDYELMIFTSPSAIENFIKLTAFNSTTDSLKIASIGKTTTEAIERFGFHPVLTASKSNVKVLTKEILEFINK